MTDNQINSVIDIAIKLLRENPELKYYQAIERAKEMIKSEEKGFC